MRRILSEGLLALPLLTALAAPLAAQCTNPWLPAEFGPIVDGSVGASTLWDPDGGGPQGQQLVVAGLTSFGIPGTNLVARWDGTYFQPIGGGIPDALGAVACFAVLPDGSLVAGGSFSVAEGSQGDRILRWNGSAWVPLGGGMNSAVTCLLVLPNGDLIAGGFFTFAGGQPAARVARWNGTAWSALGSGIANGYVAALVRMPNGDLIAAGTFTTAGGSPGDRLARWNGSTWSAVGGGADGAVYALAVMPNGDLAAGGLFTTIGGTPAARVARWNGVTWSALGTGVSGAAARVETLKAQPDGSLVAAGSFATAGGAAAANIARWDGITWNEVGGGVSEYAFPASNVFVYELGDMPNGDLFVGGNFDKAGGGYVWKCASWNGAQWAAFGNGLRGQANDMLVMPDGEIVLVGLSMAAPGWTAKEGVVVWDGGGYQPIASYATAYNAVARLPNGDLVAASNLVTAGSNQVRRWDGVAWTSLGTGMNGVVTDLAVAPNGDVIATGTFTSAGGVGANRIARWNGTNWSALGAGLAGGTPSGVAVLPNGDVVVTGEFTSAGGLPANRIARWNGAAWSAIGSGLNGPGSFVTPLLQGGLVVGGSFSTAGGLAALNIARWNGVAWSALGSGLSSAPLDAVELPDGDIVVVGPFTNAGGVPASRVARWNGTAWSGFGTAVNPGSWPKAADFDGASGTLVLAGDSGMFANGLPAAVIARLGTNCPATVAPLAAGCPSSGGSNTLTVTSGPWVDGTLRATGSGLPAQAFVLALTSVNQVTPGLALDTVFPQAQPGCNLYVAPDILQTLVATGGTAQSTLLLPNVPPLVGVTFFHQMVPIEVDGGLNFVAITATNAVQLTAGQF